MTKQKNFQRPPQVIQKPVNLFPQANPLDRLAQAIGQHQQVAAQHQQAIDMLKMQFMKQQQISDQYRYSIYILELKNSLLIKMLEEKNLMAKDELEKRWPLYLKNDVGAQDQNGHMAGLLKVTKYER